MGACCSKNTSTAALTTPSPQQFDLKPDPQQPHNHRHVSKKEIFVIKHRISHEIHTHQDDDDDDDPNDTNPSATTADGASRNAGGARSRTSSCTKEEVDAILIQCGRLSRSNSAGAQNPNRRRRRRHSASKRSFDFDLNARLKYYEDDNNDDDGGGLSHRHRQQEARISSLSRRSSRERDPRQQRSVSGRRISISPSRRSESPFRNLKEEMTGAGGSSKPAKMIPVPATDKSNNSSSDQVAVGSVKRIHVKRNVGAASPRSRSPAKTNHLRPFSENQSQEQTQTSTREADHFHYRRKSLAEIDNNATRSLPGNTKMAPIVPATVGNLTRIRRLSQDLDINPETMLDRPSPPSYASLLLEDIHKFHQKNASRGVTAPPEFSLPACVTKACSIMEAVADLNATSSLCSDDRWKNPSTIEHQIRAESEMVVNDQLTESSMANPATGESDVSSLRGSLFRRELLDCPRT